MSDVRSIPEDRPLSGQERSLVRWLLDHGNPLAAKFLPQVDQIRVVSRCSCGCASIDFAIPGQAPTTETALQVLSDFKWETEQGAHNGVFVFANSDALAGLEVWSMDGIDAASQLPAVELLKPVAFKTFQ